MKTIFENVIKRGGYDLTGLLKNIDKFHIEGKLTDEERNELYAQARHEPKAQYNYDEEIEKLWAAIRELKNNGATSETPADEWPVFVMPTGAHDAYQVGDQVTFNDVRYRCVLANCVWAPDVYPAGWQNVETE